MYYEEEFFQDEFDVRLRTEVFVAPFQNKSVADMASFHNAYSDYLLNIPMTTVPKHVVVRAIDKAFSHLEYKHMPTLIWAYHIMHKDKQVDPQALHEVPLDKADVLRYARRFIFYG
ncbi:hypothetical protein ECIV_ORF20 [European chub iridovirus]|nr:hypothetical protein ECIV_ORF20 [European chub iridovirus]